MTEISFSLPKKKVFSQYKTFLLFEITGKYPLCGGNTAWWLPLRKSSKKPTSIFYGQADREHWLDFFGVCLTLEYDYMCSETTFTQEKNAIFIQLLNPQFLLLLLRMIICNHKKGIKNAFLNTLYPPLPHIFWTVWIWGFTRWHPKYTIPIQKIE